MAKRRLAILRHAEEVTGNLSLTCRYYGISRQCLPLRRVAHPEAARAEPAARLPAAPAPRPRWPRDEQPLPGHRVQLDVKFIAPLPGSRRKHDQFTAIDDCTRLRVLRIYPQLNQQTAIQFLD
jgi:hypothetical protein